jgi:hypothetical protein
MHITAKLARLEKLAGMGSCPNCRLVVRSSLLSPSNRTPEDAETTLIRRCPLCGRQMRYDLSEYAADVREIVRLSWGSTFEETFTDPRVWVAWEWWYGRRNARKERRKVLSEIARAARPALSGYERDEAAAARREARREREASPGYKLRTKLMAESRAAFTLKRERLEAEHGEDPFPDLAARLNGVTFEGYGHLYRHEPFSPRVRFSEMYHTEMEAKQLLKCAEAEKILLGDVAPSTAAKLAECEHRAKGFIEDARRRHEADEEERRRKEEEQAQRQRELLERSRSAAPADPPPAESPIAPAPKKPPSCISNAGTLASSQSAHHPAPPTIYGADYWSQLHRPRDVDASRLWVTGRRRRPR